MNELIVLETNDAPEDVELITWRGQAVRRMEREYKKLTSAERRERKREREKACRKMIRICSRILVIFMSGCCGVFLAKGDLLGACGSIVISLLGITAISQNGEYENGK